MEFCTDFFVEGSGKGRREKTYFLKISSLWFAMCKITGRAWVPGRRALHGLRGQHDVLHKKMDE
jgi:hypothetical protein